jgi:Domain of Unknown Function (DUF1206)
MSSGDSRAGIADAALHEIQGVERARPFRWLVRAGFVARGITYGVIGALTFAMALGAGTMGAPPNQQGALALIARSPLGRAALVVICAGLLAYAFWKLSQGIFGRGPEGAGGLQWKDRVANLGGGVAYLGFFAVAIRILTGSSGNSSAQPRQAAAGILAWPGGQLIVGIAGGGLMAISLYQLYDALRGEFAKDVKTQRMGRTEQRVFMRLGRIGLTARALVFALVGYFLVRTAIDFNPNNAAGVDGALARLHHQPLGPYILGLVAAGLLIFAAFSLLEARYRRL